MYNYEKVNLIPQNNIKFYHIFLFHLQKTFDMNEFLHFVNMIDFNKDQIYFFGWDKSIKSQVVSKLLPFFNDCFLDAISPFTITRKGEQSITLNRTKKFVDFYNNNKKTLQFKDAFYVYIGACGVTYETLLSFGEHIQSIKFLEIHTETYEVWKNQHLQKEVFDLLCENNFLLKYIKKVSHYQNISLWIHN